MPKKCCVSNCKVQQDDPEGLCLSFYQIPADENVKKQWLESIKQHCDIDLKKYSYVCSRHFEKECFDTTCTGFKNGKLKKGCCPTIFVNFKNLKLLPRDSNLCSAWKNAIGQENLPQSAAVFRKHFRVRDYLPQLSPLQAKRLKPGAIPVRFLPIIRRPPRPNVKELPECASCDADDFLEDSLELQESDEIYCHQKDPLSVETLPVLSVDRNKNSKQLLITIDATSLKSPQEDHNYTLKVKPTEVKTKPRLQHEESMMDSNSRNDDNETEAQTKPPNTKSNSNKSILYGHLKKNLVERERIKWIKEANRRKNRIEQLQRKVKVLQNRLRKSKQNEEQMKILSRSVKNYTRFSEIDNILSGRFKELCKTVNSNAPKKLDYTPNVINFAISLYYLSPKAYEFVKKYMDLPHTNILQKYLESGTYIINLDE